MGVCQFENQIRQTGKRGSGHVFPDVRRTTPSPESQITTVAAAPAAENLQSAKVPSRLSSSSKSRRSFKPLSFFTNFTGKSRSSSSTAAIETKPKGTRFNEKDAKTKKQLFGCPICYEKLMWNGDPVFSVDSMPRCILKCSTCNKTYSGNKTHLDLTITSGSKKYDESFAASSELFRVPLVSFLYEKGWRQAFSIWCGFPGPEKEFELMKDYLNPVIGGNIIDASCGSGMFSRLFAKSGLFSLVVALDFSESMLKQTYNYINQDENISKENLILVRADIARLPFSSSSMDAVHAGAALHCWPSPSSGVAEISRILRPGGVFVATTYIIDGPFSYIPFLYPMRENMGQISGSHLYLSEREIEELFLACGLVDYTFIRNGRFIMICARKPN
uniref:uncharacterized methyltransferase At1g78140, chloroplastic-like isoform X2 n=1 Tax=Erigeron canadensis TaxID=72917 RepID=UPI001CB8A1EE|nr:uncharacterized methyltransferase At1g78140, chloroplastic-like isoform X2 [Erigeron canadensis]